MSRPLPLPPPPHRPPRPAVSDAEVTLTWLLDQLQVVGDLPTTADQFLHTWYHLQQTRQSLEHWMYKRKLPTPLHRLQLEKQKRAVAAAVAAAQQTDDTQVKEGS